MSTIRKFFKGMLQILPFKKPVFLLIKKIIRPSESIYKHLYFNGTFDVNYKGEKVFQLVHHGHIEENEIFWNNLDNGWEKKSISVWIDLCRTNNNILDIGANSGVYGITAKAFNSNAQVHCFEPLEAVVAYLKQNIELNTFDITVHSCGLSDYDGVANVYLPEEKDFVYSVTVNVDTVANFRKSRKIEIDVMRLDSMITSGVVPIPQLIKMDVERHEYEVLKGMGKYLTEARPDFIIEVLDEEQAEKLNSVFGELNYLYFNIDDEHNSIRQTKRIEKSDYWNYLVCKSETAKELKLI